MIRAPHGTSDITVLGFDYGLRRIGVAVGQTITHTASPLCVIRNSGRRPDWLALEKLLKLHEPQLFVVGRPSHADRSRHTMADDIERFGRQLQSRFRIAVEFIDERLSSVEAQAHGLPGDTAEADSAAAQVILETWLNESQNALRQDARQYR